jgi:hypothetical protein
VVTVIDCLWLVNNVGVEALFVTPLLFFGATFGAILSCDDCDRPPNSTSLNAKNRPAIRGRRQKENLFLKIESEHRSGKTTF